MIRNKQIIHALLSTSQIKLTEESVSNFSHPDIVVDSLVDGDEDEEMTPQNWSDVKLVAMHGGMFSKHHNEIDFENGDSIMTKEVPDA